MFDDEHAENEERWITLGQSRDVQSLVVVHTYQENPDNNVTIRIISARKPTKHEQLQYVVKHMKTEYDFSKGTRGKFFRPDTELNLPVYLDNEVLDYFKKKARSKDIELNQLVNDLLRKDIDMIESVK